MSSFFFKVKHILGAVSPLGENFIFNSLSTIEVLRMFEISVYIHAALLKKCPQQSELHVP